MLVASGKETKDFELCPEGTFVARIFQIIDLGTLEKSFKGEPAKKTREVRIGLELLDESAVMKDGKPFTTGATFAISLHEKAKLRKVLESIRGKNFTDIELKGFELIKIMGAYCLVTIVHTKVEDKTYANISAYSPMHKSMAKPDAINTNLVFDLDADDYLDTFNLLPKWTQERVKDSFEWQGTDAKPVAKAEEKKEEFVDDVPF